MKLIPYIIDCIMFAVVVMLVVNQFRIQEELDYLNERQHEQSLECKERETRVFRELTDNYQHLIEAQVQLQKERNAMSGLE